MQSKSLSIELCVLCNVITMHTMSHMCATNWIYDFPPINALLSVWTSTYIRATPRVILMTADVINTARLGGSLRNVKDQSSTYESRTITNVKLNIG